MYPKYHFFMLSIKHYLRGLIPIPPLCSVVSLKSGVYFSLISTSQFGLATFKVLSSHTFLVATVLLSVGVNEFYPNTQKVNFNKRALSVHEIF